MMCVGCINGTQYGVGFPIDMPVLLIYFEDSDLKIVAPDFPEYDELIDHVSNQLENNDLHLFKTPMVLTLQGEFEDEDMNTLLPPSLPPSDEQGEDGGEVDEELDFTIAELLEREKYFSNEDDDSEDDSDY
ncbi:MAG: hypothetical protein EOP34_09135 [Rickettsiales bacterium]|nr:MAG: hypothetical protein EOP34_09135 [Rickettsiales bacterium]